MIPKKFQKQKALKLDLRVLEKLATPFRLGKNPNQPTNQPNKQNPTKNPNQNKTKPNPTYLTP